MDSFEFVALLVFQCKILENVNLVSKTLQSSNITLDEACKWMEHLKDKFQSIRDNFEQIMEESRKCADTWKINNSFSNKRIKKVKLFHDELCEDTVFKDPTEKFKTTVFYPALDILNIQIKDRFESMKNVRNYFSFLEPQEMLNSTDEEFVEAASKLANKYEEDISSAICGQIVSFKNIVVGEIIQQKITKITDIAKFLFMDNNFLTAERSFSKLKLIKSYLRSTMSQKRLTNLAVLSIECDRSQKLDLDSVIREFMNSRQRRMKPV